MNTASALVRNPSVNAAAPKLLVVDDEESIHAALARVLGRLGFDMRSALDGAAALEALQKDPPQVVLLDLRMPGMDGHTLLRRVAALPRRPAVVIISGEGTMEDVIDVLRAGAVDYVKKPWTTPELVAAITRAIEIHEEQSERHAARATESPVPAAPATGAAPAATGARQDALFRDVLERLRRGEIPLPAAPAVVVSLRSSALSPTADLCDIAAKIEQDQRLSADMLRMANAAHFARLGRATTVQAAVQRLGLRHVHNLVETLFLQGFFKGRQGRTREQLTQLWRWSVARAVTMRSVCDLVPRPAAVDADLAYLCGLMADVGASLLLWVEGDRGGGGDGARAALRRYHEELGATLLERWGFEPAVVAFARQHHPLAEPSPTTAYAKVGIVASELAAQLLGDDDPTGAGPVPAALMSRCASELQLSDAVFGRLMAQLQTELSVVVQTVG